MDLTTGVAVYAAIVATGALFLEVRRWFESGPRLNIHVMPEAKTFNLPGTENNTYLVATVKNRGNSPTTITHFVLRDYGTWFSHICSKPVWTAVVPNPTPHPHTSNVPKLLQPGEIWSGMARYEEDFKERVNAGYLYVLIYASHADKPVLKRVHRLAKPPEDAERV